MFFSVLHTVLELYVFAGLAKSKNEVRRLIKGGGARINDVKVVNQTSA